MTKLSPSNFKYKGNVKLINIGMTSCGFAYNYDKGTFYTIGYSGQDKFGLKEFSINVANINTNTVTSAVLVKDWGWLNDNNILGMSGLPLTRMHGLLYRDGILWVNYGSYYANGANLPCIAAYKLNSDGTKTVYGPWTVDATVHSDRIKGMTKVAPFEILEETQKGLITLGVRGSTSQGQSWGPGLVSIERPSLGLAPNSNLNCKFVSHWPMKLYSNGVQYSDYPRPDFLRPTKYLRTVNGVVEITDLINYSCGDYIHGGTFVKGTLLCFSSFAEGYQWYGSPNDYSFMQSEINPGQPVVSAVTPRGGHYETLETVFIMYDVNDIVNNIKSNNMNLLHYNCGKVTNFGGSVPLQTKSFGEMFYDEQRKLLFAINHGGGNVGASWFLVWNVD